MFTQLNITIFSYINQFAGNKLIFDTIGVFLAEKLPYVFLLLFIFLWFYNEKYKNIILYSGYSIILGLLINFLITLFYFHPRPYMENIGTLLINHLPETSFPSDHTTFMLSMAFLFLYFKSTRKIGIVFSFIGLTGGLARIFIGVHFPFDIMGSIIVSFFASFFVFRIKKIFTPVNNLFFKIDNLFFKR